MLCPKCKKQITKNDLICPHCKKVLKLKCHECGTISKNSVCKKCGTVLINKCNNCGKLNFTNQENCPNCGLNIDASIGLKESLIDEFAALTIEITNFDEVKKVFKSNKITEEIKNNIYLIVKKIAKQKQLRVQFLNNTFIIRFCKDFSFETSCTSAIDFSISFAQIITNLNKKLFKAKGISLKTQMIIQKRTVYSKTSEYHSGFNISVVYSSSKRNHLFNNINILVDSFIYQSTKKQYPYQSLSALYIKNQMVMFFEIVLSKLIQIKDKEEKSTNATLIELKPNIDYQPEEIDEKELIKFDVINCSFIKTKEEKLYSELQKIILRTNNNPIISIKGHDRSSKLATTPTNKIKEIFNEYEIIRFSCNSENKYCAYGLFKQILINYKKQNEINLILNNAIAEQMTANPNLENLLKNELNTTKHPEETRAEFFEAFKELIIGIPFKTLFVIEDIDYADDCSLEILKYIIENEQLGNVAFLFSYGQKFSLHRKIYKLMIQKNYSEIETTYSSNKAIVQNYFEQISQVKNSFYFEKILENTKGSHFYFLQALEYLVDNEIFEYSKNKYSIETKKMLVLSANLDELIQKRILNLQNTPEAFDLYSKLILLSEKFPSNIIKILGTKNPQTALEYLTIHNFVEIIDNNEFKIKNFNLYKKNFYACCPKNILEKNIYSVLSIIFSFTKQPNYITATLLEKINRKKDAFSQWHFLAMFSGQFGDFASYLNCTNQFLSLVDNVIDPDSDKSVSEIKQEVYTDIAIRLYQYYPEKVIHFLEKLLTNTEIQKDKNKIKEISNKLVQSCLMSGNYNNALEYISQLTAYTEKSSFNPSDKNFNLSYFLVHLVTIELFFNLGKLKECVKLGDELFKNINIKNPLTNISEENISQKYLLDSINESLFIINLSRVLLVEKNCEHKINEIIYTLPNEAENYKLLLVLLNLIQGKPIEPTLNKINIKKLNHKYSNILYPMILGIVELRNENITAMANYFYQAKINASQAKAYQATMFCDLMIGYAYLKLENNEKAKQIFYDILESSSIKGLKNISYISWFLIAKAEKDENNITIALEILKTSLLKLEKDKNVSQLFTLILKVLYGEIIAEKEIKEEYEQVLYACEQAFDLSLNLKITTYLPQIADILIFVYNQLIEINKHPELNETYKTKAENIYNIMSQLFVEVKN